MQDTVITNDVLAIVKTHLRISTDIFDDNAVKPLCLSAVADLSTAGVIVRWDEALHVQAVALYVRAYFNADKVNDTFLSAYERLKTLLALVVNTDEGDTDNV